MIHSKLLLDTGMSRDLSISKFSNTVVYENMNIRINASDELNVTSVTNEKSNAKVSMIDERKFLYDGTVLSSELAIKGTLIGSCISSSLYAAVFTKDNNNVDRIYRLKKYDNNVYWMCLFEGSANFSKAHPIQCVFDYENSDVVKVYFIDDINQPRLINLEHTTDMNGNDYPVGFNDNANGNVYDFVRELKLEETVSIEKDYSNGTGMFKSGVIQYVFTYFNAYGIETNPFFTSDLFYINPKDRGGEENETCSCVFNITLNNVETQFDYIRIYSVLRTTLDATCLIKHVVDIATSTALIKYTDNNQNGENVDSSSFKFIKSVVSAKTIESHEKSLFLGNITVKNRDIPQEIKNYFRTQQSVSDETKDIQVNNVNSYYYNQIDYHSRGEITFFKQDEYYRVGVQLQYTTGEYSEPIFVKDYKIQQNISSNDTHDSSSTYYWYDHNNTTLKFPLICLTINLNTLIGNKTLREILKENKVRRIRPIVVYPKYSERNVLLQGIMNPTVYNYLNRIDNAPYVLASWFFRPFSPYNLEPTGNISKLIFDRDESMYEIIEDDNPTTVAVETETKLYGTRRVLHYEDIDCYIDTSKSMYDALKRYFDAGKSSLPLITTSLSRCCVASNEPIQWQWSFSNIGHLKRDTEKITSLLFDDYYAYKLIENWNCGAYAEFRHNCLIPGMNFRNAESNYFFNLTILSIYTSSDDITDITPYSILQKTDYSTNDNIQAKLFNYYIDLSIQTIHSPEIEFDENVLSYFDNGYKLRIVGFVPITDFNSQSTITTNNGCTNYTAEWKFNSNLEVGRLSPDGVFDPKFNANKVLGIFDKNGWKMMINAIMYFDADAANNFPTYTKDDDGIKLGVVAQKGFCMYPWHKLGSISGIAEKDGVISSELKRKILANNRHSYLPVYFDLNKYYNIPLADAVMFSSKEIEIEKIKKPESLLNQSLYYNYYGNSDKTLSKYASVEGDTKYRLFGNIYISRVDYCESSSQYTDNKFDNHYSIPVYISDIKFDKLSVNKAKYLIHKTHDEGAGHGSPWFDKLSAPNTSYTTFMLAWSSTTYLQGKADDQLRQYHMYLTDFIHRCWEAYYMYTPYGDVVESSDSGLSSRYFNATGNFNQITSSGYWLHWLYLTCDDQIASIKYTSTKHGVVAFDTYEDTVTEKIYLRVAPTCYDSEYRWITEDRIFDPNPSSPFEDTWSVNNIGFTMHNDLKYIWEDSKIINGVYQDSIDIYNRVYDHNGFATLSPGYGFLWLIEMYRDILELQELSLFGGNSDSALCLNIWLPAGDSVSIENETLSSIKLVLKQGDTYFQRYQCLKTYPSTEEDTSSVVEVLNFMCETKINLNGRTDKNKDTSYLTAIRPTNINIMNNIYSLLNNYFNYTKTPDDIIKTTTLPTLVVWSSPKLSSTALDSDPWTNISLSDFLNMDGRFGEVVSVNDLNQYLYCFLTNAVSRLRYKISTALLTTEGTAISTGKGTGMDGYDIESNVIGCLNKWSVVKSDLALYFIDNVSKSLFMLYGGKIENVSSALGFDSFIRENNSISEWNPLSWGNFTSFYDRVNKDVYFINSNYCLAYNETLKRFTSFYSYYKTPSMGNLLDNFIALYNNGTEDYVYLYNQFCGIGYNNIYGIDRQYYIDYKINIDGVTDKIFNTFEFRGDAFDPDGNKILLTNSNIIQNAECPFDEIEVSTEYQKGSSLLSFKNAIPSNLKLKYRMWRVNIPRDNNASVKDRLYTTTRDRMRNPWLRLRIIGGVKQNPTDVDRIANKHYEINYHNAVVYFFA